MLAWLFTFFLFSSSVFLLCPELSILFQIFSIEKDKKKLVQILNLLREWEELFMAGLIPSQNHWGKIQELPAPWARLISENLNQLRTQGVAILPTLRSLRTLVEDQVASLSYAKSRSSQAYAQAMICFCIVPLFGTAFYACVPQINEAWISWLGACLMTLCSSTLGGIWMIRMTSEARWGGLPEKTRSWLISSQCVGERFLAFVRGGTPPDLAWVQSVQFLQEEAIDLATIWGHSVWETSQEMRKNSLEKIIISTGESIKKAIQVSLMEGRPSLDRVESALAALRLDIRAQIDRELMLLPTRVLKPLFLCIGPSILGLLLYGFYLISRDTLRSAFDVF